MTNAVHEIEKCGQDLIIASPHPLWLCDHDPLYPQTLPLWSPNGANLANSQVL